MKRFPEGLTEMPEAIRAKLPEKSSTWTVTGVITGAIDAGVKITDSWFHRYRLQVFDQSMWFSTSFGRYVQTSSGRQVYEVRLMFRNFQYIIVRDMSVWMDPPPPIDYEFELFHSKLIPRYRITNRENDRT